jgi:hypothetical protein
MAKKKAKQGVSSSASTAGAATATKSTSQPVTAQNAPKSVAAQVRSSRKRRQQRVNMAIGAGVATVIVAGIAMQVIRNANLPGERFPSQGNLHLVSINSPHVPYNSDPPTSGPHMPTIAAWGSYLEPIADEYLVHNMEDAGVVLWYEMGTPEENAARVAALEEVSRGWRRVIIVPRENLGSQYVFTAWTRMQRFDDIDEEAMRRFIDAYEGIDHHPR